MSSDAPTTQRRWSSPSTLAAGSSNPILRRIIPIVVLGALPWLMLAVSADWIYSDSGLIDAWLYHGYFHRWPEFASTFFRDTYYGTRLAWIVPGYVAYHLLTAHAANVALHLTFYYVAIAALYRAAAILAAPPAALIAATAFGTALPTIVAFGWDYVDGAVITYTLVAIWAVVEASARQRRYVLLAVAGAAAACTIHSNLAAVTIGPAIVIAYWCTHARRHWWDLFAFVSGGVIITAVLGLCSVAAGGSFLFFMPSVRWAGASLGTQTFTPAPPLKWPGSARFVIPLAGLGAAVGAFAARRTPATRTALLMMFWLAAVFIAYDWIFSAALLQTQYYVSWFLPLGFLGLAVALGPTRLSLVQAAVVAGCLATIQIAALAHVPVALHLALAGQIGQAVTVTEIAIAGAMILIIAALGSRGSRPAHAIAIVAALALANYVAAPNLGYGPSTRGRSQFDTVQQTLAFIRAHVPRKSQPRFWIQSKSKNASYYASLASTHLYLYSLISVSYPKLRDEAAPPPGTDFEPGDFIVVVADTKADQVMVNRELEQVNRLARIVLSVPIHTDQADFTLTLFDVTN